jgi:hypothetical protein
VEALALHQEQGKNWIPAFAGMTSERSKNWIPAQAGMTSKGKHGSRCAGTRFKVVLRRRAGAANIGAATAAMNYSEVGDMTLHLARVRLCPSIGGEA